MNDTKTASLEALRSLHERGETLPDKDVSVGEDLPDDFWDNAQIVEPKNKRSIHLRVDEEVFDFFHSGGKGHLTRMHAVLKSYVRAQKKRDMIP